jgi:hypothetical protein
MSSLARCLAEIAKIMERYSPSNGDEQLDDEDIRRVVDAARIGMKAHLGAGIHQEATAVLDARQLLKDWRNKDVSPHSN